MKAEAIALARGVADPAGKLNLLREYLQAMTLRSLHESEAFVNLAFVGGTALRFLHRLPRFSEDLDFTLVRTEGYKPETWLKKVKADLALAGFEVDLSLKDAATVHKAWIRIGGILQAVGLSPLPAQKLSIKLEIDTRPPTGATLERTLVNHHFMLALQHHDRASLMAGKLHALLTRAYPKGRDWYDLIWYRAQRPPVEPNVTLLQHALDQTQGRGAIEGGAWRQRLLDAIGQIRIDDLREDVAPFLEHPEDARLLSEANLRAVLRA